MNNSSKSGLSDKFRPPATKVCRLCKKELPIKNFSVSFKGRHGYANECRSCKKEHEDQRAEERKERAKTFFDAKFFMLLILLTASLSGVGQERSDTVYHRTPDTVHAIILITTSTTRSSISRTVKGYVVKGERPVYLDCQKREIKLPVIVWGWREEFKRLR